MKYFIFIFSIILRLHLFHVFNEHFLFSLSHTVLINFFFILYNIVLVLPYINMNPPRMYTCSPSWTPLPSPTLYHPSGSSQCTSPKHPVSCIEQRSLNHWTAREIPKKFFIFIFYLFFKKFYNIVLVLPYINMNPPRVYTCSPSWTPLPPPSLYHPSGSSQCTSPKHPVSCIELGLAIHFIYDIIYVSMPFSQIIPHSPLPQSPKDCSIHLCLFCCLAYRVIITIFLNSIYMH